jgi:hypothetical protein
MSKFKGQTSSKFKGQKERFPTAERESDSLGFGHLYFFLAFEL